MGKGLHPRHQAVRLDCAEGFCRNYQFETLQVKAFTLQLQSRVEIVRQLALISYYHAKARVYVVSEGTTEMLVWKVLHSCIPALLREYALQTT